MGSGVTSKTDVSMPLSGISRKAVFNRNEVFVVEDGRLRKKQVSVHKLNPSTVLFSGLNEGEMVVIDPPVNASENMKVNLAAK